MAQIIYFDTESYTPNATVTILPGVGRIDSRGLSATAKAPDTLADPSLSPTTLNITVTSTSTTEPTPAVSANELIHSPLAEAEHSMLFQILEFICPRIKPFVSLIQIISSAPRTHVILGSLHFLLIGSVIYSMQNAAATHLARVLPSFACPYNDFVDTNGCVGPKDCLYVKPGSCSEFVDCRWSQARVKSSDKEKDGREEKSMVAEAVLMECPYSNDVLRLEWNDNRKRCDYPGTEGTCSFRVRDVVEEDRWKKRDPEHWTMVSPAVLTKKGYDRIWTFVTGFCEGWRDWCDIE